MPGAPRRKSNTTLIILISVLAVFAFCVALIVVFSSFVLSGVRAMAPTMGCVVSFQAARDAVLRYAQDNNGLLPSAETWQDDVAKYLPGALKDMEEFPFDIDTIKPEGVWGCKVSDTQTTGIAFNDELAGKRLEDVQNPYGTVMLFEIESARRNAHESFRPRPMSTSPRLFGERRGWMTIPVQGEGDLGRYRDQASQ
jgi:hypothetical protein